MRLIRWLLLVLWIVLIPFFVDGEVTQVKTPDGTTVVQMSPEDLKEFLRIDAERVAYQKEVKVFEATEIKLRHLVEEIIAEARDTEEQVIKLRTQRNILVGIGLAGIIGTVLGILVW